MTHITALCKYNLNNSLLLLELSWNYCYCIPWCVGSFAGLSNSLLELEKFVAQVVHFCCSNLSKRRFIIEMIICRGYMSFSLWKDQTSTLFPNSFSKTQEEISYFLTVQSGPFQGCSRIGGPKRSPFLKPVTHIIQWWNLAQSYIYRR